MADLNFDSTVNYQKIYIQGTVPMSVADPNIESTTTITHNLGYVPNVKVWFTNAAGQICPVLSDSFATYLFPLTSNFDFYSAYYQIYTNTLKIYFSVV